MKYFFIFLSFFLISCSNKAKIQTKQIQNDNNQSYIKSKYLMDLEIEQNIDILPDFNETIKITKDYKKKFFYPFNANLKNVNIKNLIWFEDFYKNKDFYFFNKQKIPKEWFEKVFLNANFKNFAKINKKAIITKNALLRNIPTEKAILLDPFKDGEGIPFDYAQDGVLNAGMPVLISHYSKDKKFAFILCEYGFGFTNIDNLEIFSKKRALIYEKLNFTTPVLENINIYGLKGNFLFETRIGALYPYYKEDKNYFYGKIGSNKYKISKKISKKFPIQFNNLNIKNQIKQMINKPYGWGGYEFERDCSLLTKDFFSSFGIYLPRNSYSQSKYIKHFDISNLKNDKKQILIEKFGKKYLTLLYMKGHIVLYIGNINGKNAVFQNIWGIKTMNDDRLLISKSVISSLTIGQNETNVKNDDLLISKIKTISFININERDSKSIQEFINENMVKLNQKE